MTRSSSKPERSGVVRVLGTLLIVQGALGLVLAVIGFAALAAPVAHAERISTTAR